MYLNKKNLNLLDSAERIRRVGLRSLNLLGNSQNKTNSPKTKSSLTKNIKKQKLLAFINTPKSLFPSKIKSSGKDCSLAHSLTVGTRLYL